MSAQPQEIVRDATAQDALDLFQPRTGSVVVNGVRWHCRALNLEERTRCEQLEKPTMHDGILMAVAMGCINPKTGEPLFGPYGKAMEVIKRKDPTQLVEIANEVFRLSGMAKNDEADAEAK